METRKLRARSVVATATTTEIPLNDLTLSTTGFVLYVRNATPQAEPVALLMARDAAGMTASVAEPGGTFISPRLTPAALPLRLYAANDTVVVVDVYVDEGS